jgi:two-component system sensor histidine kinase TctE
MMTITHDQGTAVIAVADDGPGLSESDLDRIGGRFVRLSTSIGKEGSGLGLAIVYSAAQRLGARLRFTNTKPGLRVELTFPNESLNQALA